MSERTTDRALHEEVQELERESRRTLSPLYLAEVDRRKKEFLDNPDGRPNSGMREGDIARGDINDVIRMAEKTVIFGLQTRLRAGILMKEDERTCDVSLPTAKSFWVFSRVCCSDWTVPRTTMSWSNASSTWASPFAWRWSRSSSRSMAGKTAAGESATRPPGL